MRLLVSIVVLFGLLAAPAFAGAQSQDSAPAPGQERRIRIYVGVVRGPDEELARRVRARLVDELILRGLAPVESEENADAVLTGGRLHETTKNAKFGRRASVCIRGDLQLVAARGSLLWAGDLTSDRYAVSQISSFVQKASKEITAIMEEEARRRNIPNSLRSKPGEAER